MRPSHACSVLALCLLALTPAAVGPSAAAAAPPTVVTIAAQLIGPSGTVTLQAHLRGTPDALVGTGTGAHHDLASEARFELAGALDGSLVTLSGTVTQAGVAFLLGTPVEVTADSARGVVTHTFGPIAGGPPVGATLTFAGSGAVVVR